LPSYNLHISAQYENEKKNAEHTKHEPLSYKQSLCGDQYNDKHQTERQKKRKEIEGSYLD